MQEQQTAPSRQQAFSRVLASVIAQVGFLTLAIVVLTLVGGMWLDSHFGTKPLLTIFLLVASIPFTAVMMYLVVRRAAKKLEPPTEDHSPQG